MNWSETNQKKSSIMCEGGNKTSVCSRGIMESFLHIWVNHIQWLVMGIGQEKADGGVSFSSNLPVIFEKDSPKM